MSEETRYVIVDGVKYYRYKTVFVTEDGLIVNASMKKMEPLADHCLWIKEKKIERNKDGSRKRRKYKVNRIVYEAISGDTIESTQRVINIDGNPNNYAFSNLKKVSIKELSLTKNFSKQFKVSPEDREKIRNSTETDDALAKKYDCSKTTIRKIRKGAQGRAWYK